MTGTTEVTINMLCELVPPCPPHVGILSRQPGHPQSLTMEVQGQSRCGPLEFRPGLKGREHRLGLYMLWDFSDLYLH